MLAAPVMHLNSGLGVRYFALKYYWFILLNALAFFRLDRVSIHR